MVSLPGQQGSYWKEVSLPDFTKIMRCCIPLSIDFSNWLLDSFFFLTLLLCLQFGYAQKFFESSFCILSWIVFCFNTWPCHNCLPRQFWLFGRVVVLRNRIQRCDDEKLKILVKNSFLKFKNLATNLPLDLNEGHPRYKRSFQPSKENIQHFTTIHFFTSFFLWIICATWIRIPNANQNQLRIHEDPVPGLQHCLHCFSVNSIVPYLGWYIFFINTFAW